MSIVSLKNIQFTYAQQKKPSVSIGNFSVEKKERVFIYGPSGSGKTTFLEILAGVLVPQSGEVKILDQELGQMSSLQRDQFRAQHLGYIFQNFNLIPYLSVAENIELPVRLNEFRRANLKKSGKGLDFLLQALGIAHLKNSPVTELSIGQQQRVAAARALLGAPEIILADEPTSSLDYDHREKFINLLFSTSDEIGTTVIFVSHDRTLEKLFSKRYSFLEINRAYESP